jgi:hypothetical protein
LCRILNVLRDQYKHERVLWVNIREEPIVYINGEPYVLRDQWATLRNIKAYSGIAASRLEQMEEKLREDVLEESKVYRGRVLLHSEVLGALIPLWEYVESADHVVTPRSLFRHLDQAGIVLEYIRVPVTAEEAPEPKDFDMLSGLIALHPDSAIVFNCQMGAGRSTAGAVIALQYLAHAKGMSIPDSFELDDVRQACIMH